MVFLYLILVLIGFAVTASCILAYFMPVDGEPSLRSQWKAEKLKKRQEARIGYWRLDPRPTHQIDIGLLIQWEERFKAACGHEYVPAATSLFPEMKPYLAEVVSPIIRDDKQSIGPSYTKQTASQFYVEQHVQGVRDRVLGILNDDDLPDVVLNSYVPYDEQFPQQPKRDYIESRYESVAHRIKYPNLVNAMKSITHVYRVGTAISLFVDAFGHEVTGELDQRAKKKLLSPKKIYYLMQLAQSYPNDYANTSEVGKSIDKTVQELAKLYAPNIKIAGQQKATGARYPSRDMIETARRYGLADDFFDVDYKVR